MAFLKGFGHRFVFYNSNSTRQRISKKGHTVDFYSPGKSFDNQFTHHHIPRSQRRGFQARSVAKNLSKRIEEFDSADVVLIDWPIFSIAKKIKSPVILIDRGPPADKGILAKLQWRPWIKSWGSSIRGTTVSPAHKQFVSDYAHAPKASIAIIPAGVDLDLFEHGAKGGPVKLAYHGRVDVHRGVMSLPMILAGLHSQGVDAELHIHGNGDAINRLQNIEMDGLKVTEAIPQDELASLLSTYDIGYYRC